MGTYILKRLLLIIPTLFLILLINFMVIQLAPGGPVEQAIQQAQNFQGVGNTSHAETVGHSSEYQGARGLSDEMVEKSKHNTVLTNRHLNVSGLCSRDISLWTSASVFLKISPLPSCSGRKCRLQFLWGYGVLY